MQKTVFEIRPGTRLFLVISILVSMGLYMTRWYQLVLFPGEIGRLCADHCSSGLHDSYPMSHTSSDGGGIELHPVDSEIWFTPTYAMTTPTQKFKIVFWLIYTPFWEPILISKCAQSFICDIFDPPTQWPAHAKLKKTKKTVSGTFLKTNFSKNEKDHPF